MWLVAKNTTGRSGRVAINTELRTALVRWYSGTGTQTDHKASVSLATIARENGRWIACDCLGEHRAPPLMTAAYLSFQETYYLRRLTSRPSHDPACPFHCPQAPWQLREASGREPHPTAMPRGLFSALQKAPEKLAQKSETAEPDDSSIEGAIPRLGKLLWLLIERAGANVLEALPQEGRAERSIGQEMRRLRRAAEGLEIAPGIKLSDHLYTNAIDYEKRRVHARLRQAAAGWPEAFAPQAFLLLEANAVTASAVVTGLGIAEIRNPIQHSGILQAEVSPPFLVLAVVGEHSRREGYRALRAYAQPVLSGNRFIPAERSHDREILRALEQAQYGLRQSEVRMAAKKILFDGPQMAHSARPDYRIALLDENTGEELTFALQILRSGDLDHHELRRRERDTLREEGRVIALRPDEVTPERITEEARRMLGWTSVRRTGTGQRKRSPAARIVPGPRRL